MKKYYFLFAIALFISAVTYTQTTSPERSNQQVQVMYNTTDELPVREVPVRSFATQPDTATSMTQQFFKEFNGVTYRIVINEYPYAAGRSAMLVYKLTNNPCDRVPIIHFFLYCA